MSIPVIGNTWAVGLAFQFHLVIVAFIMGIAILAPTAELMGLWRKADHWDRLARDLTLTIVRSFSFGATWAVLAIVLIYGLYPRLFGVLTSIFFWPLLIVGGVWFVMTVSAYACSYTWKRLGQRRWLHMAIGWTFAVSAFLFITLITELSSYQLTPTDSTDLLTAAMNPSWLTEITHRHIGNLSYAGLILAGYAGVRGMFAKSDEADRIYYDWLGELGLLLGGSLALLQPIIGWLYAHQIEVASPDAYKRLMTGENSWLFLVQTFFFGAILFLGNLYLASAIRRGSPGARTRAWVSNSVWAIGILALLGIVPKEWPLGQMTPWKYISLAGTGEPGQSGALLESAAKLRLGKGWGGLAGYSSHRRSGNRGFDRDDGHNPRERAGQRPHLQADGTGPGPAIGASKGVNGSCKPS